MLLCLCHQLITKIYKFFLIQNGYKAPETSKLLVYRATNCFYLPSSTATATTSSKNRARKRSLLITSFHVTIITSSCKYQIIRTARTLFFGFLDEWDHATLPTLVPTYNFVTRNSLTWHCRDRVSSCNTYAVQQDAQCGLNE